MNKRNYVVVVVVLLMKLEGRREKDVVCLENEEQ
jgi:hypothetical protein